MANHPTTATNRFPNSKITTEFSSFDKTDSALEAAPPWKQPTHKVPLIMKFPIELGSNEYPNVLQFRIFYRSNTAQKGLSTGIDDLKAEKQTAIEGSKASAAEFKKKKEASVKIAEAAESAEDERRAEKAKAMNEYYKTPEGFAASHGQKGVTTSIEQDIRAQELEAQYATNPNLRPPVPPVYENDPSVHRDWKNLPGGGNAIMKDANGAPLINTAALQQREKDDAALKAKNSAALQAAQGEYFIKQTLHEQEVSKVTSFKELHPPGSPYNAGDPKAPKVAGAAPQNPIKSVTKDQIPKLGTGQSPADKEFNLKQQDETNIQTHADKAMKIEEENQKTYNQTIADAEIYGKRLGGRTSGAPVDGEQFDQMVSIYLPYCVKINNEEIFSYEDTNLNILGQSTFLGAAGVAAVVPAVDAMKFFGAQQVINATSIKAGLLINPRLQKLFKSKEIRSFTFTWEMYPRNKDESNMIRDIIQQFRSFSSPSVATLVGLDYGALMMPGEFEVRFLNKNNTTSGFVENEWLPRLLRFVINSISVDYTPQGIWGSFVDNAPLGVVLTMAVTELYAVNKEEVEKGY